MNRASCQRHSTSLRGYVLALAIGTPLSLEACSGSADPADLAVGGTTASPSAGGATASGGATIGTGLGSSAGGSVAAVAGGSPTVGGADGSGGVSAANGGATTTLAGAGGAAQGGTTAATSAQPRGGSTASGGATASVGGATQAGGSPSKGGTSGTGAATSGGMTAKGGTTSAGGTTSKGGTSSVGGATATGGTTASTTTTGTPDCNSVTGQPILNVAADGSGQYATVQAAVNSLSTSNTTPTQIRIKPGTYKEKLVINRPNITLCGQTGKATTTIFTYSDAASTSNGNGGTLGTSGSASTNLSASNVSAENLTFANSTAKGGGQAVALLVTGSRVQFRNCRFLGYQDTLYVKSGTQYFKNCYIAGTVDFIFGAATAVFDNCSIYSEGGGTALTAPSTDQATAYGLVFLGGTVTAASGVASGSVALGRNWGAYGAAAYLKTNLGAHISAVGWQAMGSNTLDTARFSEYQTTGTGASAANLAKRAAQSKQLSAAQAAAYTIAGIFGAWTPTFSQ